MRLRKASINILTNIVTYILGFLPVFFVRKEFLNVLGNELLGLSSLYSNIIGMLSIVELGIGTVIIFSLYKPFAEKDIVKVKGYLDYYSRFYIIVGGIVLIIGMLMLPYLGLLTKNEVNMTEAQLYFILYLINTFISYLFSYKACILNVAQEGYKVSVSIAASKLTISILQIFILRVIPSFYLYIFVQILINLVYYISLNKYIDNRFKWINTTKGRINNEDKAVMLKNVKALFLHKVGGTVLLSSDSLVISTFISLGIVGKYYSYNMIIGSLQGLISNAMSGITASIGNLLVEEDKEKAYKVHSRLFFISFWIVSFITISLQNTIRQFITIWLGYDQILDEFTVGLLLVNFYFISMRGPVERFKEASGNYYQDRYSPICEAGINIIFSIILVNTIGLPGVFLGTLISNLSTVFWIKPKITYKYVFDIKLSEYFKTYFKYLFIACIPLILTYFLTYGIRKINSTYAFGYNCLVNLIVINLVYTMVFWRNKHFIYFKDLLIKVFIYKKVRNINNQRSC
jgi:O-antigen/teichoic acid export membrane protein